MSGALKEDDEIIVPNVPVIAAIPRIDNIMKSWSFHGILKTTNSNEFKRLTEDEFIWGYSDDFLTTIKNILTIMGDSMRVNEFGMLKAVLYNRNSFILSGKFFL